MAEKTIDYSEDSIRSLDWKEHIRLRPGMYIGKLGDGSAYDDGIYVLLKEIVDNSIDEFVMGQQTIEINMTTTVLFVPGRYPAGKVTTVSKINTGGNTTVRHFKIRGLNGVGKKRLTPFQFYSTILPGWQHKNR